MDRNAYAIVEKGLTVMAGEYFRWKYRDVKPEEKRELTKAEKRKNWWDYHKWFVVLGIVAVLFLGGLVWNLLGIGRVRPDYQIAYVGSAALPGDTVAALETAFSELGEDLNGDGKVVVTLNQYVTYADLIRQKEETGERGNEEIYMQAQASRISLTADIDARDSFFFLLDDPEGFQQIYEVLSYPDGTLPEGEDWSADGMYLSWTECPVLSGLELGSYTLNYLGVELTGDSQELLSQLYIARRGFWTGEGCDHLEGCEALWEKLCAGA